MTTTRSKATALLDHLIENLLQQDASSELALGLKYEGVMDLPDVMSLHPNEIEMLAYPSKDKDGNEEDRDVPKHPKQLLRILQSYIHFLTSQGNPDYLTLTKADFDDYRIRLYNPNNPHTAQATPSTDTNLPRKTVQPFYTTACRRLQEVHQT